MNEMLCGFRLHVTPDMPKMQLSPDLPVTEEFRTEFNAWMLEFFGTTNLLDDDTCVVSDANRTIMLNPRMLQRIGGQT